MKLAKGLMVLSMVFFCIQGASASIMDQYAHEETGNLWAGWYQGGYATAQAISPIQRYLYEVKVKGTYPASVAGTLILTVQGATADNLAPDWPGTVVLGSKAVVISAGTPAGEVSFDFSDNPIDLNGFMASNGNGRVFLNITADYSNTDFIFTMQASNNPQAYSGSCFWITPGTSWNIVGQDLWFETWGSAVPEPLSMMLLTIGGLFGFKKRR